MSEKQKDYVTWTIFIWAIGIILLTMGWVRFDSNNAYNENKTKIESYIEKESDTQQTLSLIREDVGSIKTNIDWLKNKK